MQYEYPIFDDWSTEEIIEVIQFFQSIEKAYEAGIRKEELLNVYKNFKRIVPGKADERNICREFEKVSGYSAYHILRKLDKLESNDMIKM